MSRLAAAAPALAAAMVKATEAKRRLACAIACEAAVAAAGVRDALIDEVLVRVRDGGSPGARGRAALESLAAAFDDEYLDLQDALDEGRAGADPMIPFVKARAVCAVLFAADDRPDAAGESICEALMVFEDGSPARAWLLARVEAALR